MHARTHARLHGRTACTDTRTHARHWAARHNQGTQSGWQLASGTGQATEDAALGHMQIIFHYRGSADCGSLRLYYTHPQKLSGTRCEWAPTKAIGHHKRRRAGGMVSALDTARRSAEIVSDLSWVKLCCPGERVFMHMRRPQG